MPTESLLLIYNGLTVYNKTTQDSKLPLSFINDIDKMQAVISKILESPNKRRSSFKLFQDEKITFKIYNYNDFKLKDVYKDRKGSYGEALIVTY